MKWLAHTYKLARTAAVTVQSTRPGYAKPAYPFTLVRFSNNTALILPPEAYQRWSEISPLAVSVRFTLRWRWGIGILKSHPKAIVNGGYCYLTTGHTKLPLRDDYENESERPVGGRFTTAVKPASTPKTPVKLAPSYSVLPVYTIYYGNAS